MSVRGGLIHSQQKRHFDLGHRLEKLKKPWYIFRPRMRAYPNWVSLHFWLHNNQDRASGFLQQSKEYWEVYLQGKKIETRE
jgi:hypothetical protein